MFIETNQYNEFIYHDSYFYSTKLGSVSMTLAGSTFDEIFQNFKNLILTLSHLIMCNNKLDY